jgi:hypothetical protein
LNSSRVEKEALLERAADDVEDRRVDGLVRARVHDGAAHVMLTLAFILVYHRAARMREHVANHPRVAAAAQDARGEGPIEEGDQAQERCLADAISTDRHHGAAGVQLRNAPGRPASAFERSLDVHADDAA